MDSPEALLGPFPGFNLAQVNIGRLVAPLGDPAIEDFTKNLARVNDQGKAMPGFVWLLEGSDPELGATDVAWPGDPEMFVNLTVWESVSALRAFAFSGEHRTLLARRKEFFQKLPEAVATLWWIPVGTVPTIQEAHDRLAHFREHGPTPHAFSFQRLFAPEA
jgi:heme-degrading monooxygenase HmoA